MKAEKKERSTYYLTRKNRSFVANTSKLIGLSQSGYINLLINRNIVE